MAGLYSYARPGYQTGGISMGTRAGVKGRYGRFRREFEDVLSEQSLRGLDIQAEREGKASGYGYLGEMGGTLLGKMLPPTPMGIALRIGLPMVGRYLLSEGYRKHGGGRKAESAIKTTGGGTTGRLWRGEARDVRGAFGAQEKALKAGIGAESVLAGGRALSRYLAGEATKKLGDVIGASARGGEVVAEGGGIGSEVSTDGVGKQSWWDKFTGGKDATPQLGTEAGAMQKAGMTTPEVLQRPTSGVGALPTPHPDVDMLGDVPLGDTEWSDIPDLEGGRYPWAPMIPESEIDQMIGTTTAPFTGQEVMEMPGEGLKGLGDVYGKTKEQNMLIKRGLGGNIPDLNQYLMDQGVSQDALGAHKAGLYQQFSGSSGEGWQGMGTNVPDPYRHRIAAPQIQPRGLGLLDLLLGKSPYGMR